MFELRKQHVSFLRICFSFLQIKLKLKRCFFLCLFLLNRYYFLIQRNMWPLNNKKTLSKNHYLYVEKSFSSIHQTFCFYFIKILNTFELIEFFLVLTNFHSSKYCKCFCQKLHKKSFYLQTWKYVDFCFWSSFIHSLLALLVLHLF